MKAEVEDTSQGGFDEEDLLLNLTHLTPPDCVPELPAVGLHSILGGLFLLGMDVGMEQKTTTLYVVV